MRALTLDEKISLNGLLDRKGWPPDPRLSTATAVFRWGISYGKSIAAWFKYPPVTPKRCRPGSPAFRKRMFIRKFGRKAYT